MTSRFTDKDSTHNVIEFYTTDSYAFTEGAELQDIRSLSGNALKKRLPWQVSYSGPNNAPEDIQVTIAIEHSHCIGIQSVAH